MWVVAYKLYNYMWVIVCGIMNTVHRLQLYASSSFDRRHQTRTVHMYHMRTRILVT